MTKYWLRKTLFDEMIDCWKDSEHWDNLDWTTKEEEIYYRYDKFDVIRMRLLNSPNYYSMDWAGTKCVSLPENLVTLIKMMRKEVEGK